VLWVLVKEDGVDEEVRREEKRKGRVEEGRLAFC
jgi:hypothetical protein